MGNPDPNKLVAQEAFSLPVFFNGLAKNTKVSYRSMPIPPVRRGSRTFFKEMLPVYTCSGYS